MNDPKLIEKESTKFNIDIVSGSKYDERRTVKASKTIFYDELNVESINFSIPKVGWCTIPENLKKSFCKSPSKDNIFRIERTVAKLSASSDLVKQEFLEKQSDLIKSLANHYIDSKKFICEHYPNVLSNKIIQNIGSVKNRLQKNFEDFICKESAIEYIDKLLQGNSIELFSKQTEKKSPIKQEHILEIAEKMTNENIKTIKEICKLIGISKSKFYQMRKRLNSGVENNQQIQEIRENKNKIFQEKIQTIKELADDPNNSFTIRDICEKLNQKFEDYCSYDFVRYHLKKTLRYSRKRTHFRSIKSFEKSQSAFDFLVCEEIIKNLGCGNVIYYLDESGFGLSLKTNYSYSQIGFPSIKANIKTEKKLHLIMAVNRNEIFAYKIQMKGFNETAYISFLIDTCEKLYEKGRDYYKNISIYIDNASFHKSKMVLRFYSLIPIKFIFGSPSNSDLSMIENIFGIIKSRVKRSNPQKMYY